MQKYHDEPKQYKGYLKSALGIGTGTLTAKRGDVLVEIGISKSLAKDEQEQIEMSKQLATLVAAKF